MQGKAWNLRCYSLKIFHCSSKISLCSVKNGAFRCFAPGSSSYVTLFQSWSSNFKNKTTNKMWELQTGRFPKLLYIPWVIWTSFMVLFVLLEFVSLNQHPHSASSHVFQRKNKVQDLNDTSKSEWWQNLLIWANCSFMDG